MWSQYQRVRFIFFLFQISALYVPGSASCSTSLTMGTHHAQSAYGTHAYRYFASGEQWSWHSLALCTTFKLLGAVSIKVQKLLNMLTSGLIFSVTACHQSCTNALTENLACAFLYRSNSVLVLFTSFLFSTSGAPHTLTPWAFILWLTCEPCRHDPMEASGCYRVVITLKFTQILGFMIFFTCPHLSAAIAWCPLLLRKVAFIY